MSTALLTLAALATAGLAPTPAPIHVGFDRAGRGGDGDAHTLTDADHLAVHPEDGVCPECERDEMRQPQCPRCMGVGDRGHDCPTCEGYGIETNYPWERCTAPGCRMGRRATPVDYRAALIDGADGGAR